MEISIKTTNLIIFALFTNILLIVVAILKLPSYLFLLDISSDCISIYLSYSWSSKYYQFLFKPCNYTCYTKLCNNVCYHCCMTSKKNPSPNNATTECDIAPQDIQNEFKNGSNSPSPMSAIELEQFENFQFPELNSNLDATSSNISNSDVILPEIPDAIDTTMNTSMAIDVIVEGQSTVTSSYDMTHISITGITSISDNGTPLN